MNSRVTLKQIAEATGYSINTVSHALRNLPDISPTTSSVIRSKAEEMGYIVNSLAQSMRSGKSGFIAIIISDITNPLFSILAHDLDDLLSKNGYCSVIFNTNEDDDKERRAIKAAISKQMDGIIICPAQHNNNNILLLKNSGIPFVLQGRYFKNEDLNADYVVWDDQKGMRLATDFLFEKGYRNIAYLSAPTYISSAELRLKGFQDSCAHHNISPEIFSNSIIVMDDFSNSRSVDAVLPKLAHHDAVLAFNDIMAYSLIRKIKESDQLCSILPNMVVGFDNIQSRILFPTSLTTVQTPKKEMCQFLVQILLDRIAEQKNSKSYKKHIQYKHILIDVSLHIADT